MVSKLTKNIKIEEKIYNVKYFHNNNNSSLKPYVILTKIIAIDRIHVRSYQKTSFYF